MTSEHHTYAKVNWHKCNVLLVISITMTGFHTTTIKAVIYKVPVVGLVFVLSDMLIPDNIRTNACIIIPREAAQGESGKFATIALSLGSKEYRSSLRDASK